MIHYMSEFKWALWWLSGGAVTSFIAGLLTVSFAVSALVHWQFESVLFGAITATTAWLATAMTLSSGRELFREYRKQYSRAEDMHRENISLRKRLMWSEHRRAEGEADGAGGTVPSGLVRFLVPPKPGY
jgi:hypothetical protein